VHPVGADGQECDHSDGVRAGSSAHAGSGLGYFPPKQLRHTFGTNLRCAGADLDTTRRLMGHQRVSTTAEVYVQRVSENELAAVDSL
jgi:site-specific recombinase XerD